MKAAILSGLLLKVLSEFTKTIGMPSVFAVAITVAKPSSASGESMMPFTFLAISSLR